MEQGYHLAIDLGAGSGRIMAYDMTMNAPDLVEIHRFANTPVSTPDGTHWNALQLLAEVRTGLDKACEQKGGRPLSMAVDTWGVDYALLGPDGALLGMPYFYRDNRSAGMVEQLRERISDRDLFMASGIQPQSLNTIYQLMAEARARPEILKHASSLLFMPDLFNYWLSGKTGNENTITSTSGLWNAAQRTWNRSLIELAGLPGHLFGELTEPGTLYGECQPVDGERKDWTGVPVVTICSHDTASAVMAVSHSPSEAIISLGSWAIVSHVMPDNGLTEEAFDAGFSVEGAPAGKWRYASNHTGLWLMQRYRKDLQKQHIDLSYRELERMAAEAAPAATRLHPDDPRFTNPVSMLAEMSAYLEEQGQPVPQSPGEWTRLIYRSLAISFAESILQLERVAGHPVDSVRIIGGGAEASCLCQMIANASGLPVTAGPVEATAYGNIMVQCAAIYDQPDVAHWQERFAPSWATKSFHPARSSEIEDARSN
jgi:sugar (pentulose or hexulose) kinase